MSYQITKAGWFLYEIGVSFYETGVISKGKVKLFDYYKADKITEQQKEKILTWCKDVKFMSAQSRYAPELIKPIICFPKAGFYRTKEA